MDLTHLPAKYNFPVLLLSVPKDLAAHADCTHIVMRCIFINVGVLQPSTSLSFKVQFNGRAEGVVSPNDCSPVSEGATEARRICPIKK